MKFLQFRVNLHWSLKFPIYMFGVHFAPENKLCVPSKLAEGRHSQKDISQKWEYIETFIHLAPREQFAGETYLWFLSLIPSAFLKFLHFSPENCVWDSTSRYIYIWRVFSSEKNLSVQNMLGEGRHSHTNISQKLACGEMQVYLEQREVFAGDTFTVESQYISQCRFQLPSDFTGKMRWVLCVP